MESSRQSMGAEGCSSSESGWTMYLASPMEDDCSNIENEEDGLYGDNNSSRRRMNDKRDEEDSDDSMASDASSGRPTHHSNNKKDKKDHHGGFAGKSCSSSSNKKDKKRLDSNSNMKNVYEQRRYMLKHSSAKPF